jgi:hypothetical protein
MNRCRFTVPVVTTIAVAIALCGCSSLVVRSYPGGPPGSEPTIPAPTPGEVNLPIPDLGPHVQWAEGGEHLAITLGGSSTCPTEPKHLSVASDVRIDVEIDRSRGWLFDACTADLKFTTYEVRVPDGISESSPVAVTIGDRQTLLPARKPSP